MNRIKEVLQKKGITQTWLAEELGKSYNMVNSYAQNRQQPRLEFSAENQRYLGCRFYAFATGGKLICEIQI